MSAYFNEIALMSRPSSFFQLLLSVTIFFQQALAQKDIVPKALMTQSDWSVANAHSHNDYEQNHPFTTAYQAGFGSMEADILLYHDSLFVGHSENDLHLHRLLSSLYLDSIRFYCRMNQGWVYKDKSRGLQLLIDLKTTAEPTLQALVKELQKYPELINSPTLLIVITGNRPPAINWGSYPDYIYFDADAGKIYTGEMLKKIGMISGNLAVFSSWKGKGGPDSSTVNRLNNVIKQAHVMQKKIRFWNAPDNISSWEFQISMRVDWINTDHIDELASFLHRP
jgi:alkaline phosphatase